MTWANITNHTEMKKQVLKYVNVDTEQMWKTFPEYVLAAHSYEEFKNTTLDQYPDATGDFTYSIVSVFQCSMEAPVTIMQRELLSLSPEVCSQVRDSTMTCHIPNKEYTISQNFYEDTEGLDSDNQTMTYPVAMFPVFDAYNNPIPKDALIVEDEVETYYHSLNSGENSDLNHLIVAEKSHSICSVNALIDNSHKVECILDPGCQIIAMSKAIYHELGLAYDPSIVLHMQSANGNFNQLLGLVHNIPFQIGAITCYQLACI